MFEALGAPQQSFSSTSSSSARKVLQGPLGTSFDENSKDWVKEVFIGKTPLAEDPKGLGEDGKPTENEAVDVPKLGDEAQKEVQEIEEANGLNPDTGESMEQKKSAAMLAKQIVDVMNKVDDQAFAADSYMSELGQQMDNSEIRNQEELLQSLTDKVFSKGPYQRDFNTMLRKLGVDANLVQKDIRNGDIPGQPFILKAHLNQLASDANRASTLLQDAVRPARKALKRIGRTHTSPTLVRLYANDVQKSARLSEGELPETRALTSAGCQCDPKSRCAMRGQPFAWCQVPGDCAKKIVDPTGIVHYLHKPQPERGHLGSWDYCVPPEVSRSEPNAEKTVHFNCRCQSRDDVVAKYISDPYYQENGKFNPELVPYADRLTIEAMSLKKDGQTPYVPGQLCRPTGSSGELNVCPVSPECSRVGASTGNGAMGVGGARTSAWFTGVGQRSWDFCVNFAASHENDEAVKKGEEEAAAADGSLVGALDESQKAEGEASVLAEEGVAGGAPGEPLPPGAAPPPGAAQLAPGAPSAAVAPGIAPPPGFAAAGAPPGMAIAPGVGAPPPGMAAAPPMMAGQPPVMAQQIPLAFTYMTTQLHGAAFARHPALPRFQKRSSTRPEHKVNVVGSAALLNEFFPNLDEQV